MSPLEKDSQAEAPGWHALPVEACLQQLRSGPEGLSAAEAEQRLAEFGPNTLPAPPTRSALRRFLAQFHNILIYVLIGTALITLLLNHLLDAAVISAVVIANALIGFLQEGKAKRAMAAIQKILAGRAAVIRDGERQDLAGEALVPGDLVLLEAGDKVPADLRLLSVHGLQAQEAILTGESVPVDKSTEPVAADAVLGDQHCLVFSGTLVTSGQGRGIVVATGSNTQVGRIGGMLTGIETLTTPLVSQMNRFARALTAIIIGVAVMLLLYGYFLRDVEFLDLFMAVVGLSVAAIPEGLPAVLTITLAVGVQAMARQNAIVRRLPVIETLGSVSVICTDKTGTLTRNEMMVASVVTSDAVFTVEGNGYDPHGAISLDARKLDESELKVLEDLSRAAILCNDASITQRDGHWEARGDPMEGALLAFAGKAGGDLGRVSGDWPRTDTIPFDPRRRYMATLHHDHQGHNLVFVKGAPEQLLTLCRQQRNTDGSAGSLDASCWQRAADDIAAGGQRVLALAHKVAKPGQVVLQDQEVNDGLVLLGLVGLIDPPRPEAAAAVAECRQAGIRVKMITGDHRGTAAAIGRQIGLTNSDDVITGTDLDAMTDAQLQDRVLATDIFARTSPEHKLRLVMALQSHGLAVAMTGDGVNDAPALRRADAGIAMGRKGSEAAKEAAEFVLADDNFATIVAAIREGRTVYDNIKKVISWTLPTSAGEALTIIVAILMGLTLPISPIQILWINLITTVTLGLALAFEPTEENTMSKPPRRRDAPLLGGELAWHILLVSVLFVIGALGIFNFALSQGLSVELARTLTLNMLVVLEIFHLFFIRNIYGTSLTWKAVRGTRVVWLTVVAVTVAQFAITYFPPMQLVFETRTVSLFQGLHVIALGVVFFMVIELEKQVRLRLLRRNNQGEGEAA